MQVSEFYRHFKENMESMGLPAPATLFGSLTSAVATATTILSQIDKFGKNVTIKEIVGAGSRLEQLAVLGACSAAFYVGAVIGSIAVATGRTLGNGATISDVLFSARRHGLDRNWLFGCMQMYPGIYQTGVLGRRQYRYRSYMA
jgi:hypothetical protein